MNRPVATFLSGALLLVTGGCLSTSADIGEHHATPAVLDMNLANKQKLESAASQLLYGRKVSFSLSAFAESNMVSIEKVSSRDERGQLLNGRELEPEVIVFSLWKHEQKCWLKRDDTDKRFFLDGVTCDFEEKVAD